MLEKAAAERAHELHGCICITPDEVAMILANLAAFKSIAEIKHLFPGADFLDVHLDRSLLAGAGGKPRGGSYETSRAKSSLRPALRPALHANLHVNHIAAVFGQLPATKW